MSANNRYFRPGDFLFQDGDKSHSMFLVIKGTVSVRKKKGSGYVEIAKIYPKEVLGELSFFDRLPRSAAAVAVSEVEVMEIRFSEIDAIYKKIPTHFKTIMRCVAERLRKANNTIRRLERHLVEDGHTDDDQNHSDVVNTQAVLDAIRPEEMVGGATKETEDS